MQNVEKYILVQLGQGEESFCRKREGSTSCRGVLPGHCMSHTKYLGEKDEKNRMRMSNRKKRMRRRRPEEEKKRKEDQE